MAKLNIRPLDDRLLVRREAEEKTKGGIVLPDKAKEKPQEGEILAVGIGRLLDDGKRAAMQVKITDRVLFSSYAGTEVKLGGEEYLIMKEDDVLAVLTKRTSDRKNSPVADETQGQANER